jgi:hypothetical protein
VQGVGMAKMEQLPANPTNADLAKGILQLHSCLEEHRKLFRSSNKTTVKSINEIKNNQFGIATQIDTLTAGFVEVKTKQDKVVKALGLNEDGQVNKPLALMDLGELFKKLYKPSIGFFTALFFLIKISDASWPFVWGWLQAMYRLAIK